jgi:hypothetical protein
MKSLLEIQEERLEIALKWERDKGIPNPETSEIVKSILQLRNEPEDNRLPETILLDKKEKQYGLDNWRV